MRIQVQTNRGLDGKFRKLSDLVEGFGEIYGQKVAEQLVLYSPVDTGAYMESFNVGPSAFGSSSTGRPRRRHWQTYANQAIAKLSQGVSALKGSTTITFTNGAPHAWEVEYEHGYAPFSSTAREHSRLAAEAEAEARARFG